MSDEPEIQTEGKDLATLIGEASASITFKNMKKLCNEKEYTVNGQTYKRRILKPKEQVKLFKLQQEIDKMKDPEKRMENLYEQAVICLEGMTPEKWEETDAVQMESIIGACLLISRGFREI